MDLNLFISWSGEKSKLVAQGLRDWIPNVLHNVETFISTADIGKGERWEATIATKLQEAEFGIICLTAENLLSPWIQFEAGALSKLVNNSRVCPFLIDLPPSALIGNPLNQFQTTSNNKNEIKSLLAAINFACRDKKLPEKLFETAFGKWWPELEETLKESMELNRSEQAIGKVLISLPQKHTDPEKYQALQDATKQFMELLGFELDFEGPPKLGSFWQKLKFTLAKNISKHEIESLINKGKQALELKGVEMPTAAQSEKLAKAAERIVSSLDEFEEGVIRLGSLLVIKKKVDGESKIEIRQLDESMMEALSEHPEMMKDIGKVYELVTSPPFDKIQKK